VTLGMALAMGAGMVACRWWFGLGLMVLGSLAVVSPARAMSSTQPAATPTPGVAPVAPADVTPTNQDAYELAPDEPPAKSPTHLALVAELGPQQEKGVGGKVLVGVVPTFRIHYVEFGALLQTGLNPLGPSWSLSAGALGVSLPVNTSLRLSLMGLAGRTYYHSLRCVNWEECSADTSLPWAGGRAGLTYITGAKDSNRVHLQYGLALEGGSTLRSRTLADPDGGSFRVGSARFGAQFTFGLDADL